MQDSEDDEEVQSNDRSRPQTPQPPPTGRSQAFEPENAGVADALQAIEASSSRQLMEDTLNTYYVPMEVWYTRTIIDKVSEPVPFLGPHADTSTGT